MGCRSLGELASQGSRGLIRDCGGLGKRWVGIKTGLTTPRHTIVFIQESGVLRLTIAGHPESRAPGIGERAKRFLIVVFTSLANTDRVFP